MSNTKTVYRFDSEGYYLGTSLAQYIDEQLLLPSDCTETEPKIKDGYWSKWNGSKWVNEKIPTTCAEAISKGLTCISNGQGQHNYEVKTLLQSLVAAESEDYKISISDDFVMHIEEIPEPTEEEKELEAEQKAYDENQEAINALKDDLLTATLMGDEDWIADLKAEYAKLTEGE